MSTDGSPHATRAQARAAAALAAAEVAAAEARAESDRAAAEKAAETEARRERARASEGLSPAEAAAALGGGAGAGRSAHIIQQKPASEPAPEPKPSIQTELRAPDPTPAVPIAGISATGDPVEPEISAPDTAEASESPAHGTAEDPAATESQPTRRAPKRAKPAKPERSSRGFTRVLGLSLGALLVLGGIGAGVSLTQGPRASAVAVDVDAVAAASGQRVVFTANQPLAAITPTQVTVTPAAPFTVVSSGRSVAVQFTYPLDPDTEYSIDVADVQSSEGGPAGTLTHRFRTGSPPIFLLQRRDGEDAVFSSNLAGDTAVPVFEAEQIEDFRSARDGLVAVTTEGDLSQLTAVSTTSGKATPITLPGAGFVSGLQVADHDSLLGYVFTDEAVGTPGALESTLFLGSITDPKEDPIQISVGEDSRVQQWAFVPQTSYLLVLTFDGQLHLVDASNLDADPVPLGIAASIVGVEHGSGQAIIQRNEGPVALDLTTLDEEPLPFPAELDGLGVLGEMATTAGGGTLRQLTELNGQGVPTSQTIVEVSAAGEVNELISFDDPGDGILQLCASPSGRYAAVIVAPDLVNNPYDMYKRPLPENRQTHIIDTTDGSVVTRLQGADISWCDWAL